MGKKFNYWDWREADWEDYDAQSVYANNKYERQQKLKESGGGCDYFTHILDVVVLSQCVQKGLGSQLLQALVFAFPSGTRFGVEVPATNTIAVKCSTKCGFSIARVEQGADTSYKMTAESQFTHARYVSFVRNSIVSTSMPKAENVGSVALSPQGKQINCEIMEDELDKTMKIVDDDIDGIDANVIETMEDSESNTDDDNAIVDGGSD